MTSLLYGDYGLACIVGQLKVMYINPYQKIVIVRVGRECQNMVASVLPFIANIESVPLIVKTVHVSGSIRQCRRHFTIYHNAQTRKMLCTATSVEERQNIVNSFNQSLTNLNEFYT
ncbi:ribonuclease P/MRP protein subunit POP5-like [Octopus sinensis]|uniref:Ribonuclease P/MRP protein subunit POP5 n=1 Tax=Octopus sinensis TaxID=2607531 RepID=A0A6P7TV99_9MOLL|nr:ribonuclease P/MRP protein subunit POP5-like [Octopus sinensis]XP_029656779.1 ribonuclease P/MRP protein subunit POP5-like [Octopus sinensis]